MILIDTDICIEILDKNEQVIRARAKYDDEAALCFMSIAATTYKEANLLVTGNTRHFERFTNLNIENWIQ